MIATAMVVTQIQVATAMRQQQLAMEAVTGMHSLVMGQLPPLPSKPCRYCGRTNQNRQHDNCDGCGAPKETR